MPTAWFVAAALAVAQPAESAPAMPQVQSGAVVRLADDVIANEIGVANVWIWLPPSYADAPERRFPVLYMHDGQNLFDSALTNYDQEWGIDEAITRLAARGDLREWIVVGIESPKERWQALFPEQLANYLSDETIMRLGDLTDPSQIQRATLMGDEYVAFLAETIKAHVDDAYRTLPGREDTAVMGSSMGGLMSIYAIAERPDIFGQAAGLSVHLPLGNPSDEHVEANVADTMAAWRAYLAQTDLTPETSRIYADHGTGTLDAYYPPFFAAFDAMMAELGWTHPAYESRRFKDTEHNETAWRERIDIPLAFLDRNDP